MKKIVAMGVVGVIGLAVGGCSSKKPAATAVQPAYTDVQPAPPSHGQIGGGQYGGPAYGGGNNGGGALQGTPVGDFQGGPITPVPTNPSAGTKYTVKKGDTLWSIAQRSYGDGKQYKKIVSANPAIKGDKVNVGQVLTLP